MKSWSEYAELRIEGMIFRDWESVLVIHAFREQPAYRFRFTCSEGMPLSKNWDGLRVKPGMKCEIYLAGILAFTGKVETRQVYYDAVRHHIELQGASNVLMSTASVTHKTMEWKKKTFEEIARDVLKPLKIKLKVEGGALPTTKFDVVRATPGEFVYDFLDNLARGLKVDTGVGINFTSNPQGDFVVLVGTLGGSDEVVEGKNILIGREIIFNPEAANPLPGTGQAPGTDKVHGPKATQQYYEGKMPGSAGNPDASKASGVTVYEQNASQQLLEGRITNEGTWLAHDRVTVFATVYGWLKPSGGLWKVGEDVSVTSPMLIMKGEKLTLKRATFTQDNASGTRTTLELVNANAMAGDLPQTR